MLRRPLQITAAIVYILFWIGARAELYYIYHWFWIVVVGSVICGALVARWWAVVLSLVPVILSIGITTDDAPAFAVVLVLVTPTLAVALVAGVAATRVTPLIHRREKARTSDERS